MSSTETRGKWKITLPQIVEHSQQVECIDSRCSQIILFYQSASAAGVIEAEKRTKFSFDR